jgi:hypothetical protein
MSAILNRDPDELAPTASGSHPALDRIVRRALEKEPAQRFQSARDLGFALEAVASGSGSGAASTSGYPGPTLPTRRRALVPITAALVVGLALGIALGAAAWRSLAPGAGVAGTGIIRFTLPATPFQVGNDWVAVSPDGRTLAWGGNTSSAASQNLALWVRRLEDTSAEIVRNVDDVRRAVFMSDSKTLFAEPAAPLRD